MNLIGDCRLSSVAVYAWMSSRKAADIVRYCVMFTYSNSASMALELSDGCRLYSTCPKVA